MTTHKLLLVLGNGQSFQYWLLQHFDLVHPQPWYHTPSLHWAVHEIFHHPIEKAQRSIYHMNKCSSTEVNNRAATPSHLDFINYFLKTSVARVSYINLFKFY